MAWFGACFLLVCGGLVLLPGIDLRASALFYRPAAGFFLGNWAPFRILHEGLPAAVKIYVLALIAITAASLVLRRPIFGLRARAALYLLLALAVGPGLIVNTIFKDHWGRARPSQIVQFGGDKRFTPAFVPSDQCGRNCSFPAGDPAVGFYLVSMAFLAGGAARRRAGLAGGLAAGAALGVVRLAQGGHFLSDVIASGFLVYATSWTLSRLLIARDGLGEIARALRRPPPGLRRLAALTLVAAIAFALAYAFVDRPLARVFETTGPALHGTAAAITRFGEGGIYLVPLGLVTLGAWLMRRTVWAWRAGFVFAAIALAGLIADIAKPVFGRARPVLLFREHLFGFTWSGAHADHWSFPSGHSVTVTALAVALYAIYPRLWPAYALGALAVMASRILLDAHYLSDVIAGAYLGFIVAWALTGAARRRALPLALPRGRLSDTP